MTDAERGPPSSVTSPKYSPAPIWLSCTSRPFSSATNTFARPASMM
jgi:hypothetical protein